MADLAYTANIQDRIAYLLENVAYTNLSAAHKALLNGGWSSGALTTGIAFDVFTELTGYGQWFNLGTAIAAPVEWEPWFVARTALRAAQQIRPDRVAMLKGLEQDAETAAVDAYSLVTPGSTADPGTSWESSVFSLANIRRYVIHHCARRQRWRTIDGRPVQLPRIWVKPAMVDAQLERVLCDLWNRGVWSFTRRVTPVTFTLYEITGATWTESSLTLTKTGAFPTTANLLRGGRVMVTGGTGATTGQYSIASNTTDTIVLNASIGSAANGLTNMAFNAFRVSFPGLSSTDTFHNFTTREMYYTDDSASRLVWADDGDEMAKWLAYDADNSNTGRPSYFRFENRPSSAGDIFHWQLSPFPDATYTAQAEVALKYPTLATAAGTMAEITTALERWPTEFRPFIKDWTLAEVLTHHDDAGGERLRERVLQEVERLLPLFTDVGRQDDQQSVLDVYGDVAAYTGSQDRLGGPL